MTTQTNLYTLTSRQLIDLYNERTNGEGHFFDADTMRFFNSRVMKTAYYAGPSAIVFVTSERNEGAYWNGNGYTHYDEGRKYTVRVWDGKSTSIDDVGGFQTYETSKQAHNAAQAYAASLT